MLREPFEIRGLRFFWLDCASMALGLLWLICENNNNNNNNCLVFVNILGIIKRHLGLRDLLFL